MTPETQQFILMLVGKFALPFAVAVTTYYLFKKNDEYIKRRQYSTLGVAIMESLLEEINNGVDIMKNRQQNPLPVQSWSGTATIPDDVLLRIIAVSKNETPVAFKPQEIRIHCKNYFTHMADNWSAAVQTNTIDHLIRQGNYVQAAEGVKAMVAQCKELLENNSKKLFPK